MCPKNFAQNLAQFSPQDQEHDSPPSRSSSHSVGLFWVHILGGHWGATRGLGPSRRAALKVDSIAFLSFSDEPPHDSSNDEEEAQ
jgi:hypothetical protein